MNYICDLHWYEYIHIRSDKNSFYFVTMLFEPMHNKFMLKPIKQCHIIHKICLVFNFTIFNSQKVWLK